MHLGVFTQFAEASGSESGGVLGALGIDWQMLIFQIIGFLILVWLMGKFVYPILMKQVDQRQDKIEASLKAAREAEDHAASAQATIEKQLGEARQEAKDIVATAKDEANAMLTKADEKAKQSAAHTLEQAKDEIGKEVVAAKKALHNETIDLVAAATEKVVSETYNPKADGSVIKSALSNAEKEAKQ